MLRRRAGGSSLTAQQSRGPSVSAWAEPDKASTEGNQARCEQEPGRQAGEKLFPLPLVAKLPFRWAGEERKRAVIYAPWCGPAAAVDYFGRDYGLPNAVSVNMTHFLWGLPPQPIEGRPIRESPRGIWPRLATQGA